VQVIEAEKSERADAREKVERLQGLWLYCWNAKRLVGSRA